MYRDLWTIVFDFLGTCPKKDGQIILDDYIPQYVFTCKTFLDIYFCGFFIEDHTEGHTESRNIIERILGHDNITWRRQARNDYITGSVPRTPTGIIGHTIESFMSPVIDDHEITKFKMMVTMIFLQPLTITLSNRQIYIILQFLHRIYEEDMFVSHLMQPGPVCGDFTIIGADRLLRKYPQTKIFNLILRHCDNFPLLRNRTSEVTSETRAILFRRFGWTTRENDLRVYHMPHNVRRTLIVLAFILFFPITILCLPSIVLRILGADLRASLVLGFLLSFMLVLCTTVSSVIVANALGRF